MRSRNLLNRFGVCNIMISVEVLSQLFWYISSGRVLFCICLMSIHTDIHALTRARTQTQVIAPDILPELKEQLMLQHEQLVAEKQAIELNVQKIEKKVEDAEDELKDIEQAYRDSVENHDLSLIHI